jgi:uncharacterized membrane protein YhhN
MTDFELLRTVAPLWAKSFAFTLAVEIPFFVLIARLGSYPPRAPIWRLALAGAAGTCLTHPLLWFAWPRLALGYDAYIVSGELLVAVVEVFTFYAIARPIRLTRAIAASFIANGASYGLGHLLRAAGVL